MNKPALAFIASLLALILLLPIVTSADPSLASVTPAPTPTVAGGAQLGGQDSNTVCVDMSTVNQAADQSHEMLSGGEVDPQAMEDFRTQLLDLVDQLDELSDTLPTHSVYRSDAKRGVQRARQEIRQLPLEQLVLLRGSMREVGTDLGALERNVESVRTQALAAFRTDDQADMGEKPAPAEKESDVSPAPNTFPLIPTPTPDRSGIVHNNAVQAIDNTELGNLFPPAWPTDVGCPEMGYPTEVMFGLMIGIDVLKAVQIGLDTWCMEKTVTCPGTNPQDIAGCIAAAVSKLILNVTEDVRAGFAYCNGNVASARIEAIWKDTRLLHKELHEHDQSLIDRTVTADEFLFNFRNLNLRLNIEANLASPDDNPNVMLALPRQVCTTGDLERLTGNPNNTDYDPFAPEALAGCGLLEVVSDTVKSTIDMVEGANLSVNNAKAERDAALDHYQNERWKLAFDRFRKAYREAVQP